MLLGRDRERQELDAVLAGARLNRSAVLVLAGRDGEPSFVDGAHLSTLVLGGIDRDAAATLVGNVAVDRLYAATAGNPLALLELAPDAVRLAEIPLDTPTPIVGRVASG